jgi:hypothetical protein
VQNRPCKCIEFFIAACVVYSFLSVCSEAQESKAWQFPAELKPALDTRLNLFLGAQANGRWDHVSDLLGDYRRGYFSGYLKFTPSHKTCLISEMQKSPMVSFDYTVQEAPFSSEILSTPAGRRWWRLMGEGTFRIGTKTVKQKTWITAYRDRNDWFFSPPTFDGADAVREHQKEASKDRKDQVDLLISPDCPLEVVELHVFDDPKNFAARDIHFRLHNKTNKPVTRYGYEISDGHEGGSISFGTGAQKDAIQANGTSHEFHENDVVYQYWCEGEPRIRIRIDHVAFADGTEWSAPESPSPKKAEE